MVEAQALVLGVVIRASVSSLFEPSNPADGRLALKRA
jgi:hypothetical protein